jgi:hypothetical protein
VCYLRPDCALVALGPQSLAALRFVTFERELPAQGRGGRDHRFVVIDWGDVDKSHRFHAYSQRRFVEDSIVQDLLFFWSPRSSAFTPAVTAMIPSSGPNSKAGKRFRSNHIRFAPRQSGTVMVMRPPGFSTSNQRPKLALTSSTCSATCPA